MAKIVTITNPLTGQPAQADQLDHTAQQIDDAIARALPGGDIYTTLANKAPAGYGLGGNAKQLTSADNLDNIKENGWYRWYGTRPSGADHNYCTMRVDGGDYSNSETVTQTIYRNGQNFTVLRFYKDGKWIIEYVNPPMIIGEEYRTTERYMGRPLYVKMVSGGEYVQNARFTFGSSNVDNVIKFYGKIGAYCNPIINENSLSYTYTNYLKVHHENGDIVVDMLGGTKSYGGVIVMAYYTKSTD